MRDITHAIVHCSATRPSQNTTVEDIRRWHTQRGWYDIGYHWVITRKGVAEAGRPMNQVGAHTKGHNLKSIGVCLVGGLSEELVPDFNYTHKQMLKLHELLRAWKASYPGLRVRGHRDMPGVTKACPCFNVREWFKRGKL